MTGIKRITVAELVTLGALAQCRREMRAGIAPSKTLAFAAGLELCAQMWRLAERSNEAERCEREAAGVLADAAAQKVTA